MFRTTLDVDFTDKWNKFKPKDKEFLIKMLFKISECPYYINHNFKYSSYKGCHITLFCSRKCDICRLCYDDIKRIAYDSARPEYARNILFETKEKIKIE